MRKHWNTSSPIGTAAPEPPKVPRHTRRTVSPATHCVTNGLCGDQPVCAPREPGAASTEDHWDTGRLPRRNLAHDSARQEDCRHFLLRPTRSKPRPPADTAGIPRGAGRTDDWYPFGTSLGYFWEVVPQKSPASAGLFLHSGGGIRTRGLRVMSHRSPGGTRPAFEPSKNWGPSAEARLRSASKMIKLQALLKWPVLDSNPPAGIERSKLNRRRPCQVGSAGQARRHCHAWVCVAAPAPTASASQAVAPRESHL
jgi:hypothetical protein